MIAIVTTIAPATDRVRRERSLSEDSSPYTLSTRRFIVPDGVATLSSGVDGTRA